MNKHMKVIIMQGIFLLLVLSAVYFLYPKVNVNVEDGLVKFDSINAHVIIISENPDFSNPRYIDAGENVSFDLKPGKYYWKADNGIIESLEKEFVIESEVGMKIERDENGSELVNVGNVKINVTKEGGMMVGHIILEPDESEEIEDSGEYIGREEK